MTSSTQPSTYEFPSYNATRAANTATKAFGIPDAEKPRLDYVSFPADVTAVPTEALTRDMGVIAAWREYLGAKVAEAEINKTIALVVYKEHIARLAYERRGVDSANVAKAWAESQESSVKHNKDVLATEALFVTLKARFDGLEEFYKTLSRELTRRGFLENQRNI